MVSIKKLEQVYWDILVELYEKADPPLDILAYKKELEEKNEKSPKEWYNKHYLPHDQLVEIVERHFSKNKLTKRERRAISIAVYLGYSPTGHKKVNNDKDDTVDTDNVDQGVG